LRSTHEQVSSQYPEGTAIPKDKKLVVADHDFTRLNFTPSVAMVIDVPESIEGSFYRERVFVLLKDNAFQP
jgi:hypothetical protein